MKIFCFVGMFIVSFLSCSRNTQLDEIERIEISLKDMSIVEKDSIIEGLNLIPLETNKNCLITHIDKIKIINNKFYILDRKSGSIFIFNDTGQFLSKISKQGRGEGEYLVIADFDVHKASNDIYVLDGMTGNLLVYSENDFIRNVKLEFGAKVSDICFLNNGNIAFETQIFTRNSEWKYQLLITDRNFQLLSKELPYERTSSIVFSPVTSFMPVKENISYLPIYNDQIFHLTKEGILPKYKLDFGNNWIDEDFLFDKNSDPSKFIQGLEQSNSIYSLNTIESHNQIFIYFFYKGDKYAFLYDKKSKKGKFIENYMKNDCEYNGLPLISDKDRFVGVINPFNLTNLKTKKHVKNYPFLSEIDPNGNPIISYIKFKTIN